MMTSSVLNKIKAKKPLTTVILSLDHLSVDQKRKNREYLDNMHYNSSKTITVSGDIFKISEVFW